MNHLLDTHTIIWFVNGDERLPARARQAIETGGVINYVSIASLWEMAIKPSLHRLEIKVPFKEILPHFTGNGFQLLNISFEDTLTVSKLPFHHRDPFDRVIIAQSITNSLTILGKDGFFQQYGVPVLWQ